jgi:hypothetical protein
MATLTVEVEDRELSNLELERLFREIDRGNANS